MIEPKREIAELKELVPADTVGWGGVTLGEDVANVPVD